MSDDRLRREIAFEAARLLQGRQETDVHQARLRAARTLSRTWIKTRDLPSEVEIREELLRLSGLRPGGLLIRGRMEPEPDPEEVRFEVYRELLKPLEQVEQNRQTHPEGDLLYHSLQVFSLAREALPYDEEFLLAALLHEVGQAIDVRDPVRAGLAALAGWITERTAWFMEQHVEAQRLYEGTIGQRARRRLWRSDDHEELLLLSRCDRAGRIPGADVPSLDEALDYVREVARLCEDTCWPDEDLPGTF